MPDSFILGKFAPEFIRNETLPELLSPSFEKYKNKTAFIFKDRPLTYQQLDSWSNAIAHQLQASGIKSGDSVGVWYPRSMELPVAILGIIKAGAAYIPLDREMPAERVKKVFSDMGVSAYFSDNDLGINGKLLAIAAQPTQQIPAVNTNITCENYAYVLFTSGSTGNPKGIPILHRNICHLIRAEEDVIQIKDTDIVYQGFSVSFDMWCEEVWISLFSGATIWIADATTVKAIDELSKVLSDNKITVLHAVPSILGIIDEVPSIRLINAGGEACTLQVLKKWGKPYRQFINSYGPTETTVTSNMAFLQENDELTIGAPLPNYHLAVVDENMNIVPRGEKGEMVITGAGVSNGYFNLPELTAEKFTPNTLKNILPGDILYKTGDAVLIRADGFLEFHGRLDDQIKLRGYRIELGEIESRLSRLEGVSAAAVALKEDNNGQQQLVGYVIMADNGTFNEDTMRKQLSTFLAPYMVPVTIVPLKEMPRMPSGKVDRKRLPTPESFLTSTTAENEIVINPTDSTEEKVRKTLHIVFPGKEIDLSHDFFTDLGGHSLLAATFVSHLRQKAGLTHAALKDVYEHRPILAFAQYIDQQQPKVKHEQEPFRRVSSLQYYLCNIAQTFSLLIIYGLLAIQIFFPYLSYYYFQVNEHGTILALLSATLLYTLIPPFFSIIILAAKWLIIGKMKAGDYPLWGWYYFRWWLWKAIMRLMPSHVIVDTPLYPKYLRMLGVKVHPSAQLSWLQIGAEDLVTIDENVSTSSNCVIDNATVENGMLKLRRVHIKAHAYMGSASVVCGNTVIEPFGELQDLSCLPEGQTIGRGEIWNGSPAAKVKTIPANELKEPKLASKWLRARYTLWYLCTLFIFPLLIILPLAPTLYTLYYLDEQAGDYEFYYLWQTPFLALSYIVIFVLVVSAISRVLQRNMKPGEYSIFSFTYYKKWIKDQLMNLSLTVLHPLYATVYISGFYRMLGAKIGKNSEISTASDVTHHLLEIGNGSFIADAVILGEHEVRNEKLILAKTVIGNNSFVGNSGLIPQDYTLGDNMLIGVLSKAPNTEQLANSAEKDWFGSPPIALPMRQKITDFNSALTYTPSRKRKLARGIIEALRIVLPQTIVLICSVFFIAYTHDRLMESIPRLLLHIPFYYLAFMALPAFLVTVLLKWILAGTYTKTAMPMYSLKVWLSEAVTSFYEALSVSFFLDQLRGTMWLPIVLRFLGVKTGKRVWLNTTDITEYDMVTIGDEAMLNEDCGPQTHLFEDRIMKIGPVSIGSQTTIGSRTIILYDSQIGNNVSVEPLSLIMKGEILPDNTEWAGSPVKPK